MPNPLDKYIDPTGDIPSPTEDMSVDLSRIERNARARIRYAALRRRADQLGISVNELRAGRRIQARPVAQSAVIDKAMSAPYYRHAEPLQFPQGPIREAIIALQQVRTRELALSQNAEPRPTRPTVLRPRRVTSVEGFIAQRLADLIPNKTWDLAGNGIKLTEVARRQYYEWLRSLERGQSIRPGRTNPFVPQGLPVSQPTETPSRLTRTQWQVFELAKGIRSAIQGEVYQTVYGANPRRQADPLFWDSIRARRIIPTVEQSIAMASRWLGVSPFAIKTALVNGPTAMVYGPTLPVARFARVAPINGPAPVVSRLLPGPTSSIYGPVAPINRPAPIVSQTRMLARTAGGSVGAMVGGLVLGELAEKLLPSPVNQSLGDILTGISSIAPGGPALSLMPYAIRSSAVTARATTEIAGMMRRNPLASGLGNPALLLPSSGDNSRRTERDRLVNLVEGSVAAIGTLANLAEPYLPAVQRLVSFATERGPERLLEVLLRAYLGPVPVPERPRLPGN